MFFRERKIDVGKNLIAARRHAPRSRLLACLPVPGPGPDGSSEVFVDYQKSARERVRGESHDNPNPNPKDGLHVIGEN
jgi:hypothetical protein